MSGVRTAAVVAAVLIVATAALQVGLAAGAPWGDSESPFKRLVMGPTTLVLVALCGIVARRSPAREASERATASGTRP